ncbi:hypothetical protein FRC04_009730 [Tulasnella sp. 424]|nr:hypothetical protein FRC04_009730 [Tulasnella sp. 424]
MSTSKPTLDSRFVARLVRSNDPARKAELDAIAALDLEEPQEQEDDNVSRLNGQSPSPSLPGSSHHEAQPETQVSKDRTHPIGLAAPSSSSATLPASNGQASPGNPEWPITAHQSTLASVESNWSSSMSQSLHPPHPALASEIRLPTSIEPENHRRTGSHTPGHAEQVVSTLNRDATFKAQKDIASFRTQCSVQSSGLSCWLGSWDHFKRLEDFITVTGWIGGGNGTFADTFMEGVAHAPHLTSKSSAPVLGSSLDQVTNPGPSLQELAPPPAVSAPVVGGSNTLEVPGRRSNLPGNISSQSSSQLEKMFGAGIFPSDEMRRAFGHAVNRILPNRETPGNGRVAGFGDNELDAHIRHVAPILATAYSQLVSAGLASPVQVQEVAAPSLALHQNHQSNGSREDVPSTPRSWSGAITSHNSRIVEPRPRDISEQPSGSGSLRFSSTSESLSQGATPSTTRNHSQNLQAHHNGERSGTQSNGRKFISCGLDGCGKQFAGETALRDHYKHCEDKGHGSRGLRLLEEGTHGALISIARTSPSPPLEENLPVPQGTTRSSLSDEVTLEGRGSLTPTTVRRVRLKLSNPPRVASTTVASQAEVIPCRVGTVESGIKNLDKYLATLENHLQDIHNRTLGVQSMSARIKDQTLPTTVLEFLGPPLLSSARYVFEVSQLEAEAAGQWIKRMDSFDPQGDYLEYTLDARLTRTETQDGVPIPGPIVDGTVMILLNGKGMSSQLNATGSLGARDAFSPVAIREIRIPTVDDPKTHSRLQLKDNTWEVITGCFTVLGLSSNPMLKAKPVFELPYSLSPRTLIPRRLTHQLSTNPSPVTQSVPDGVGAFPSSLNSGTEAEPPSKRRPCRSPESGTTAEGLTHPDAVIISSDDKLLDAVGRLDSEIRRLERLSPYHQQLSTMLPQTVSGRSNHSWPEFAKQKKSQAMARAQRARGSLPEQAQAQDALAATPASSRLQAIIQSVDENDVVFVQAETRLEMQTEIPQILLDHWTRMWKGAECNIIVAQSRSDAQVTSEIVASQRAPTPSRQVGYEVEGRSDLPQLHGSVTFCTPGVLLRSLQTDRFDQRRAKTTIETATHIVVDNVQPRTIQMDLLLYFLKRVQAQRKREGRLLKIVFTSAPIDLSNLRAYFTIPGDRTPPIIRIPSLKPPQTRLYMEDLMESLHEEARAFLGDDAMDYLHRESAVLETGSTSPPAVAETQVASPPASVMALGILQALSCTEQGAVLAILPSEAAVKDLQAALREGSATLFGDKPVIVEVAKKRGTFGNQKPAKERGRNDVRHVILTTPPWLNNLHHRDITCVVDCVLTKRRRYDPSRRTTVIETVRATQAEVAARSAFTGGGGLYIGMISRTKAMRLRPLPEPEIGLSELSAAALTVAGTDLGGSSPDGVFIDLPDRPSTSAVAAGIGDLKKLGALSADGSLTSLGRILCQLPLKPSLGKMLVCGALLRCLDPAITLAAVIKRQADLFGDGSKARKLFSPSQLPSDVVAQYYAYTKWEELTQRGHTGEATTFVEHNRLSLPVLRRIEEEKTALFHALHGTGVLWPLIRGSELPGFLRSSSLPIFNVNKSSLATISALIAVGLQPRFALAQQGSSYSIFPGQAARPISESIVNSQATRSRSASVFAYEESLEAMTKDGERVELVNLSRLHPLAYILLGATSFRKKETEGVYVCDDWITIRGSPDFMERLELLKGGLDRCLGWVYDTVFLREAWKRHKEQIHRPVLGQEGGLSQFTREGERDPYQELNEFDKVMKSTVNLLDQAASPRQ